MSSTKTPDAVQMALKPRKSGSGANKGILNNITTPTKPTPFRSANNNINTPPTPADGGASRKTRKRLRRNKRGHKEEKAKAGNIEATAGTEVVAAKAEGKRKERKEKNQNELSKGSEDIAKRDTVVQRSNWKLSPSLGGRFLHLDPVFSRNEKYIILAHTLSLRIYSTKTSLLVRTISLPPTKPSETIVSYLLDPENEHRIYIATSSSHLFLWDWVQGKLAHAWDLALSSLQFICICTDEKPTPEFVGTIYASESVQKSGKLWRIQLPKTSEVSIEKSSVYETTTDRISAAQVLDAGKIIVVAAGRNLAIGNKDTKEQEGKPKWGNFRKYPMTFNLSCMDSYLPPDEPGKPKKVKKGKNRDPLGDVVIGDETGAMHVFHNALRQKEGSNSEPVIRLLHWHRKKVRSVKWALDGNYIISGGSETVLVMWQIETGHKQFLPHLGSIIERMVVSPQASSYAILLSDNSIMVLSTTELKPKANIAGIQSRIPPDTGNKQPKVPCVLHPSTANRLLLATPSSQLDNTASPYLQTFDTYSDRHVARQALTRTNATIINSGPENDPILEPNVTQIAITADGEWLATIDEWKPLKRKIVLVNSTDSVRDPLVGEEGHGREVYLKFWKWSEKKKLWSMVTRVDSPHPSAGGLGAEEVFDLVPSPKGHGFATVGADGSVRIWRAKIRTRAGGTQVRGVEGGLASWGCRRVIIFSKGKKEIELSTLTLLDVAPKKATKNPYWGHIAFSEDGSVVAIATPMPGLGMNEDSTIHLADSDAAAVRQSVGGVQVGRTDGLGILERYLIILGTSKLLVWNLVNSSVQWECSLEFLGASRTVTGGHLAIDHHSQTFAVTTQSSKSSENQRVFIFNATSAAPVHVQDISLVPIAALKSSEGGKGYMILDAEAKVQYISPVLAPHISVAHKASSGEFSLEDDEGDGGVGEMLSGVYLTSGTSASDDNDDELGTTAEDMDEEDGDGVVDRVVSREALESIFDAVPSYAAGSVEEAFEKVLDLFAKKPLNDGGGVQESDGDEEDEDEDEDVDMHAVTV